MSVQIKIQSRNGPAASVLVVRAGVIDAMGVVAKTWHDRYLPGHFTQAGGKKYGYQPRAGENESAKIPNPGYSANSRLGFSSPKMIENWKYAWRKRKIKRHSRPLVWSGQSEEMAKAAVKVSVRRLRAGHIEASAAMQLPKYFFQFLKAGSYLRKGFQYDGRGNKYAGMVRFWVKQDQPDKYDELTRVSHDEAEELTRVADAALSLRLADARPSASSAAVVVA